LPGQDESAGFGIHPALVDAALHLAALRRLDDLPDGQALLPFAWSEVRLHASGATRLRVRLAPAGSGSLTMLATDPTGSPVVSVGSLLLRQVDADQLRRGRQGDLHQVSWTPLALDETAAAP